MGITKAYCTRVGNGPFPTELLGETGESLRKKGHEFGATTGRPRRCGWLDLVALKYACRINGLNELTLTKMDVMDGFDTIKICTSYRIGDTETNVFPLSLKNLEKSRTYLYGTSRLGPRYFGNYCLGGTPRYCAVLHTVYRELLRCSF